MDWPTLGGGGEDDREPKDPADGPRRCLDEVRVEVGKVMVTVGRGVRVGNVVVKVGKVPLSQET